MSETMKIVVSIVMITVTLALALSALLFSIVDIVEVIQEGGSIDVAVRGMLNREPQLVDLYIDDDGYLTAETYYPWTMIGH